MKKALLFGVLSSLFFAATFVLNTSMNLSGGNFLWSATLRYFFMFLILSCLLIKGGRIQKVVLHIKKNPIQWLLYSTIGFGFFYAPLTFASNYGQSWLVAGCWQITIVAGILLTPLFGKKIPLKSLLLSLLILIGVFVIQLEQASELSIKQALLSILPILVAAFSYPFGNRKMMEVCKEELSTMERVYGMTLCSMPFWLLLSIFAYQISGLPSSSQVMQSFIVAVFSGVIATILFFKATELVRTKPHQLAIVEATQAGEVIFSIIGEVLLLGGAIPTPIGMIGLSLIVLGMILGSIFS
ncbi:putative membrane protein [Lachnospiraceae bacterium KM106-2]|nr:putative membrane protein [Lachnospiraceae bacterium KM106-2]